jgi:hypothetical protein
MEAANYQQIESKIFSIRGLQVMLDRDLAELFQVETKYEYSSTYNQVFFLPFFQKGIVCMKKS